MGFWNLDNIHAYPAHPLEGASYGHGFGVSFYLSYTPHATGLFKRSDTFQDTPKLEWLEVITMKESGASQDGMASVPRYWKFQADMYRHNPSSRTLIAWRKRYLLAYKYVANETDSSFNTSSRSFVQLMSARNGMISIDDLGGIQMDDFSKAQAVRNYITSQGCQMIIHLHDVPAINTTVDFKSKERLLEFDIGMQGMPSRIKAYQYLNVDKSLPQASWTREFELSSNLRYTMTPGGHGMSSPPESVANPREAMPFAQSGEYA
jgi:hypothetical protein